MSIQEGDCVLVQRCDCWLYWARQMDKYNGTIQQIKRQEDNYLFKLINCTRLMCDWSFHKLWLTKVPPPDQ